MRSVLVALACVAALVSGSFVARVSGSTGPIPLDCNRACLEGVIDQYLKAVVAHDPKMLPLSEDVRFTENGQLLPVGDGFWKTAQGIGNYRHVFADPEFGQVAVMATMREANTNILMSLRLRIELGRITEIEAVYFKPGGGGPNNIDAVDKSGKAEDMWFKTIPPAQRLLAPADDRDRRRLLHRRAEERRQGHQGHGDVSVHQRLPSHRERVADDQRAAAAQREARHQPVLAWTAWRSSRWASTTWCRTSTAGATRWWTRSAAWCGRTPCSTRAR